MARLLPLIFLLLWCACSRTTAVDYAIFRAEGIEVYPDSIISGGVTYTAVSPYEITNAWKGSGNQADSCLPAFSSQARMADALYHKSLRRYAEEQPTPISIYLAGALLDPAHSMEALRGMVGDDEAILRRNFPLNCGNEAWAAAAWEVYCATGSPQWLKEAYRIISKTLTKESPTLSAGDAMIHGVPSHLTPRRDFYPAWMTPTDEFQTISFGSNVWHYATLSIAARMAERLKLYAQKGLEQSATELRDAINDNFWIPSASMYGQYLYGCLYPILSPSADNLANPLSVILGIPTPEMSARLMSSRPSLAEGMPTVYPPINESSVKITPDVQALQGIAAASVGNEAALLAAIGASWRLALDDHTDGSGWPALLLRGILGISLSPEGMSLKPVIPEVLGGSKTLSQLQYREALLDISIHGTGDKIASFSIDSVRQEHAYIDAGITGRHRIDIVMSGNKLADTGHKLDIAPLTTIPQSPRTYWSDDRTCRILNFEPTASYEVYINGILSECLLSPDYTVSDTGTSVIDIVPVANGISGFSPRSHITSSPRSCIDIPATAITPRRTPLHLIRNREIASRYIELAARHNTRITFYVQAPADGSYFIRIGYSNGTSETAMRTLAVNDTYTGVIVCPPINPNDWITTRQSSTLSATLHKGVNKLSLTYLNTTILLHDISILEK